METHFLPGLVKRSRNCQKIYCTSCAKTAVRHSFLINLLVCYGIENKNVLVLDTSRFYEAQEQIQRAIDELDAHEKDSTITIGGVYIHAER